MSNSLGDKALSIVDATLEAFVTPNPIDLSETRLCWYLTIDATYDFEHDTTIYAERILVYIGALTFPEQFQNWRNLKGQIIKWSNPYEVGEDGSRPGFYLYCHQDVEHGVISFLECERDTFRIIWNGDASSYGQFSFDTWIKFRGVEISLSQLDGAEPFDVLARHLEPNDFDQEPETFLHRMSVLFKPKIQ